MLPRQLAADGSVFFRLIQATRHVPRWDYRMLVLANSPKYFSAALLYASAASISDAKYPKCISFFFTVIRAFHFFAQLTTSFNSSKPQ